MAECADGVSGREDASISAAKPWTTYQTFLAFFAIPALLGLAVFMYLLRYTATKRAHLWEDWAWGPPPLGYSDLAKRWRFCQCVNVHDSVEATEFHLRNCHHFWEANPEKTLTDFTDTPDDSLWVCWSLFSL